MYAPAARGKAQGAPEQASAACEHAFPTPLRPQAEQPTAVVSAREAAKHAPAWARLRGPRTAHMGWQ
jgi:hypothetical protein